MRQDEDVRELFPDIHDVVDRKLFMHFASPLPPYHLEVSVGIRAALLREDYFLAGFRRNISGKEFVRQKDHDFAVERPDDGRGIARSAADIGFSFNVGIRIHVSNNRDSRKLRLEIPHVVGGDARRKGTARLLRGKEDRLPRVQVSSRFRP